MVPKKQKELNRVLCEVTELADFNHNQIELNPKAVDLLGLNSKNSTTNYGSVTFKANQNLETDFNVIITTNLAQNLGISPNDYVELFQIHNSVYLVPILSQNLRDHFYKIEGVNDPRVILLSSHAEFEPYTREIATGIYLRLQELNIPSLRIELRKHDINWTQKVNSTISRYEVDITRNQNEPQSVANKLVNKNPSYRILAKIYFKLLSQYLFLKGKRIVVDIHGIATASPSGIVHPMVLIGDAFSLNPLVKIFTKNIKKSSRTIIPNLWITYNSPWGFVEYSLQLVKKTKNIPIIIENRRDLRDDSETRNQLINLFSNALKNLVENIHSTPIIDYKMISYRKFKEKDLKSIYSVYRKGYFFLYGAKVRDFAKNFINLFQSALDEGTEGEMFITEKDDKIIGFAVLHKDSTNEWKFGPIAVHPSAQHNGIGTHLLQLCINYAHAKQVQQLYLQVHENNLPAIELYKKFGFNITDIFPSDLKGKKFLKMSYSL